jgi:hypothetical protein
MKLRALAFLVAFIPLVPMCGGGGDLPTEPTTHVPFLWATAAIEAGGGGWEYRTSSDGQHRVPWGWQNETKADWQVDNCVDAVAARHNIWAAPDVVLHVYAICRGQGPGVSFVLPHHG